MDELIKQGQWWWPLLVPIATGLLALFGSWVGTKLGKVTEHAQWLRNERVKVYVDFLAEIKDEIWKLQTSPSPQSVPLSFPVDRLARIDIVGSESVRAAAVEYAQHKNSYELARSALAAEGGFLEIPGPNRARITDEYAQAHKRLIDLGESFIHTARKDLETAEK